MQSEQINELAMALSKAQGAMENPVKNKTVTVQTKTGRTYEFQYADLAAIRDSARKPLSENGLSVVQLLEQSEDGKYRLHTKLMHGSGQWIGSLTPLLVQEQGSQAFGSALTFMKRYALSAMLGIAADDDDDANAADGNPAKVVDKVMKAVKEVIEPPKQHKPEPEYIKPEQLAEEMHRMLPVNNGEPREIALGDSPDWIWFGQTMIALSSGPQWPDWDEANRMNITRMENEAPKVYARMIAAIGKAQPTDSKWVKHRQEVKAARAKRMESDKRD